MVDDAINNGFPTEKLPKLCHVVNKNINAFCSSFYSGPPASFPPLKIELQKDAKPVHVHLRNYSPDQRDFLPKTVSTFAHHCMAYTNPSSPWASTPLLVPKPGLEGFRFTVDLRPVNKFTIKLQFPMPHVRQEMTKTSKSMVYSEFDFIQSYWQLVLHLKSQACQLFLTPDGMY